METHIKKDKVEIGEIRGRHPLYRALWTVRCSSHVLGRLPTVTEALGLYDQLQLGTGDITERRVKRFQQVIEFTSRSFDPSKRRSFCKLYPVIKLMLEKAIKSNPNVSLSFKPKPSKRCAVSVESLCVGYYFALWQLGKEPDGSLPIDGIMSLNGRLLDDGVVAGPISGQKASTIRLILVQLGLLEIVDERYTFGHGRGRAKKYRLTKVDLSHPDQQRAA
jgi:hypothetical protein